MSPQANQLAMRKGVFYREAFRMTQQANDSRAASADASRASEPGALSPAMRQYQQFKQQYPGYVLFFRMGDFYEMFWDDAKTAAKALGVALTSRNNGAADEIPIAGAPFHGVASYRRKMLGAGHTAPICAQPDDPAH